VAGSVQLSRGDDELKMATDDELLFMEVLSTASGLRKLQAHTGRSWRPRTAPFSNRRWRCGRGTTCWDRKPRTQKNEETQAKPGPLASRDKGRQSGPTDCSTFDWTTARRSRPD
jgi:hypothetical protein